MGCACNYVDYGFEGKTFEAYVKINLCSIPLNIWDKSRPVWNLNVMQHFIVTIPFFKGQLATVRPDQVLKYLPVEALH